MNQKNIFVTRDVIFNENHFPYYKDNIDTDLDTHDIFKHLLPSIFDNDILMPTSVSDIVPSVSETVLPSSIPATDSSTPLNLIDIDALQHQHSDPQPSSVRVCTRLKQAPRYLKDYHTTFSSSKDVTNHSSGTKYSIKNYLSYHNFSPTYSSFCHNISSIQKPK